MRHVNIIGKKQIVFYSGYLTYTIHFNPKATISVVEMVKNVLWHNSRQHKSGIT
jgi:hypothetical protein